LNPSLLLGRLINQTATDLGLLRRYSRCIPINKQKGKLMDLMITVVIALITAIVAIVTALISRKKWKGILLYGLAGLIVGLPIGYFLSPTIISFF
jgi:hypothetical protein